MLNKIITRDPSPYSRPQEAYSLAEGTVLTNDNSTVEKGLGYYRRDTGAQSGNGAPRAGSGKTWQRW